MEEQLPSPIEWEKGKNDLEYFGALSFEELKTVLADEETAHYYATQVTYRQESRVYRPNPESISGDGFDVRPETKIIFTVGDGVNHNMRLAKDLTGAGVRTKKSDGRAAEEEAMNLLQFAHYKAAEKDEVRATVSFYLDGENNVTADMAFAEISDIFYNLFHLETTDPDHVAEYQRWENILLKALGMNKSQMIKMIAAKYHFRLFKNEGRNGFAEEDQIIKKTLDEIYPNIKEVYLKERASNFLTLADIMFDRLLKTRLKELKIEFKKEHTKKTIINIPHKIRSRVNTALRGGGKRRSTDRLAEETEKGDKDYADSTVLLILSRAEEYLNNPNEDEKTTE